MGRTSDRVTLEDVARATGYTINTVSRALKNKPDISRATSERIQQVAKEMGYTRNYIASSLRSGRTKTLAMIVGAMSNPFYAILADLIQREAFRLGYMLMILCSQDDPQMESRMVETALSRQVDGIMITPYAQESPAMEMLRASRVPYVMLNRDLGDSRDDCVLCEEEEGGYLAGKHLVEEGHRKLAMMTHRDVVYSASQRFEGFLRAAREAGIPRKDIYYAEVSEPTEVVRRLSVWRKEGVTGIFSFCDVEAWKEMTLMESAGYRIPEDFAMVSFDNIGGYVNYARPLCSVDSDFRQEAELAIDMLRRRIHDPALPPQREILPVKLICRCTCKKGQ